MPANSCILGIQLKNEPVQQLILQYSALLFVILFIVMLADKVKLPAPILLVLAGLPLGFVPAFHHIHIDPELIFVILLPPLLYEAAWNTSWKDLWKWRRQPFTTAAPFRSATWYYLSLLPSSLSR
jgi:NhaP-type Na+/H+ or K+/H+ antiporter